jgi:ATP-dependent Clp protease protease subunit
MSKQNPLQRVQSRLMATKKANILELFIYGQIGGGYWDEGVTANDVAKALKDAGSITGIKLRINSPGGSVFEGSAIYTLLQSKGVPVDVRVDGIAASAAFTIAMVGTTISISKSAMMMLHNAWGFCMGEASDMLKEAALLGQINGVMAGIYAERSGLDLTEVATMMDAETWLTADEAVAKGFANALMVPDTDEESAKATVAKFDMKMFAKKLPTALQTAPSHQFTPTTPNSVTGCTCSCGPCVAGDCAGCLDADCDCQDDLDASASIDYSQFDHRLRLAELAL